MALVIGIAALAVSVHARPGPVRAARSRSSSAVGVLFAVRAHAAHRGHHPRRRPTCCSPLPTSGSRSLLGGFTVGGTGRAADRAAVARRGLRHRRRDGGVRRVQRGGVALRARAVDAPRVLRARAGRGRRARVRAVDARAPSTTCATPTARAPAVGSCAAAGSCARSCRCSSCGLERAVTLVGVDGRARASHARRAGPRDRRGRLVRRRVAARARRRIRRARRRGPTPPPCSWAWPASSGSASRSSSRRRAPDASATGPAA